LSFSGKKLKSPGTHYNPSSERLKLDDFYLSVTRQVIHASYKPKKQGSTLKEVFLGARRLI